MVLRDGTRSPAEISETFGVSLMTAHRDIDELVRAGMVRKFHGGVTALPSSMFDASIRFRSQSAPTEKAAIAAAARRLVEPGMSIFLEDSTTTLALARTLIDTTPLTVITNFPEIVTQLREADGIRIIGLAGEYSRGHEAFLGMPCVESIRALRADIHFSSTSAMTATDAFHSESEVVLVKRAMMAAADRSVLLMDHHKFGRTALHRVAPLTEFDDLVLDDGFEAAALDALREQHPSVLIGTHSA